MRRQRNRRIGNERCDAERRLQSHEFSLSLRCDDETVGARHEMSQSEENRKQKKESGNESNSFSPLPLVQEMKRQNVV